MRFLFKKTKAPLLNDEKDITAVQLWEVEWESRYGKFHYDVKKECEMFTSEEDAIYFKKALENAFKLLRYESVTKVILRKRK